jgi:hypothetical protein
MKRIAHLRPSATMLVAVVAIVMATAGSVTAAGVITGSDIRNNTITSSDVRDGTLTSRDVRNGSLLAKDFRAGQLPQGPRGLTGATGPRGPAGAQGPSGPAGATGRAGFGLLAYPHDADLLAHGSSVDLAVSCPPGTFVTGGDAGAFDAVNGDQVGNSVVQNQSMAGTDGYTAHFDNELASGNAAQIFIDAVCANADHVVAKPSSRPR